MKKLFILFLTISVLLTGCVSQPLPGAKDVLPIEQQSGEQESKDKNLKEISANFDRLLSENKKPYELIKFIDENIEKVDKDKGSNMLEGLNKIQSDALEGYMDKLYEGNNFELMTDYFLSSKDEAGRISDVKSEPLKALLNEILDGGYKIHMVEGGAGLVIDYEKLKKYSSYIKEEMKEFIALEAEESTKPFAMDGGLIISVEELAGRIAAAEKFLKSYPDSPRSQMVGMRNKERIVLYLTGLPNTSAFNYDSKKINEEFLESYKNTAKNYEDTAFGKIVKEYLTILEKYDFENSTEVSAYPEKSDILQNYTKYIIGKK